MALLKPRTRSALIYQGDDMERMAELRRAAENAKKVAQVELDLAKAAVQVAARRIGDEAPTAEEAERAFEEATRPTQEAFNAFVTEAAERALEVRFRYIGWRRFAQLVAEHPPRMVTDTREIQVPAEGADPDDPDAEMVTKTVTEEFVHDDDGAPFNANTETLFPALLAYVAEDKPEIRTIVEPEFETAAEVLEFVEDELSEGDGERIAIQAFLLNRNAGADPKAQMYSTGSPSSGETSTSPSRSG
jgi:histone H3/H4